MSQQTVKQRSPLASPLPAQSVLQRQCACGNHTIGGGACEACHKAQTPLNRRRAAITADPVNEVPPIVHEVLRSPGQSLDVATREFMEARFDHDFSRVRVHTDAKAAESARAVKALAYTVGRDVVFGAGQHAPQSEAGRRLLAHELAHTIQQAGEGSQPGGEMRIGAPDSAFEREADRAAEGLSTAAPVAAMTPGVLRLQKKDPSSPTDLAADALKAGPKDKKEKAAFDKASQEQAAVEKRGKPSTRVEIPAAGQDEGVKPVSSSVFTSEFKKCPSARSEAGLPQAFLCAISRSADIKAAPDDASKMDTNVRIGFKKGDKGGAVWVVSASLPWTLNTTGYLDIDKIDTKMLKPYETHERGHRTIAIQIRDRLSKLMQVEMEAALPSDKKPLNKSGEKWDQDGVDAITKQISQIQNRYLDWFVELEGAADAAWDAQEKPQLNNIAAAIKAKEHKPGSSVPDVPGE